MIITKNWLNVRKSITIWWNLKQLARIEDYCLTNFLEHDISWPADSYWTVHEVPCYYGTQRSITTKVCHSTEYNAHFHSFSLALNLLLPDTASKGCFLFTLLSAMCTEWMTYGGGWLMMLHTTERLKNILILASHLYTAGIAQLVLRLGYSLDI
jgi:hypothetical protein